MKITGLSYALLTGLLFIYSCGNTPKPTEVVFDASHVNAEGDTLNEMNEKGKQGLWRYKNANGTTSDTIYKDNVAQ